MFYPKFFFHLMLAGVLLLTPNKGLAATSTALKIGDPIYVLEQPESKNSSSYLRFWELRPTERNKSQLFSGSRLLLKSQANINVQTFGLAGFGIDKQTITPGALYLLDNQHRLWLASLDEDSPYKRASMQMIPGKFSKLERGAEVELAAITDKQELVFLSSDASSKPRKYDLNLKQTINGKQENVTQLQRSLDRTLWLVTSENRILKWDEHSEQLQLAVESLPKELTNDSIEKFYVDEDILWLKTVKNALLVRYDLTKGSIQKNDLSELFQNAQNGSDFEFMGKFREGGKSGVYARVGAHFCSFSMNEKADTLSYQIIAPEFFGTKLRAYGVQYGLHNNVSSMQPREADRLASTREDHETRNNPKLPAKHTFDFEPFRATLDEVAKHIQPRSDLEAPLLHDKTRLFSRSVIDAVTTRKPIPTSPVIGGPNKAFPYFHPKCEDLLRKPDTPEKQKEIKEYLKKIAHLI